MHILMITDNDPAGMGIAFTKAINRYTEHTCRLITTAEKYGFAYEKDIHIPDIKADDYGEIEQLLKDADIFHFHILRDENSHLGPLLIRDYIKGKKILHHHHGHPNFRANSEYYRDKYQKSKRKVLVSTPDLLHLVPEATWIPNLVDLSDPLIAPAPEPENPPVVIGQAPTRKELKNTDVLIEVVRMLQTREDLPELELRIIEMMPHRRCLVKKRACHIIFDHMQGYYGVSSLESLSQGKPVIAGLDDWNIMYIKKFAGTDDLPWVIARDKSQLEKNLARLATDQDYRKAIGRYSRKFMKYHWNEQTVVRALTTVYEAL
ncbi:MAG: glycosyltransferase family 1 protein [Deltaproteobacteria bacterium]|nr:glycosyltransferase family 1 protein [Deltaproteobacteria bacterium]